MLKAKNKFISDTEILSGLIDKSKFLEEASISDNAKNIIELYRQNKSGRTKLDAFLNEYGLDNKEGVALMCLAESVLRIPDKKTRDLIISEKLSVNWTINRLSETEKTVLRLATYELLFETKFKKITIINEYISIIEVFGGSPDFANGILENISKDSMNLK